MTGSRPSRRRLTAPRPWLRLAVLGLLCAAAGPEPSSGSEAGADAWSTLAEVRDELRAESPLTASFTQTFLPSGFATGDAESGTLYVDLPKCLRFEYLEPFPKNFLMCGDWVYTWNPGEPSGRRYLVSESEAEGIDLLRLEVEELRKRYRAEFAGGASSGEPGSETRRETVRLVPTAEDAEIREATVEIERFGARAGATASRRLTALAYEDRGGNRTRFELAGRESLDGKAAFKTPPLEWLED